MSLDDTAQAIHDEGHRFFVGARWEQLRALQHDFLIAQGLQPHHVLLDIACGSLRGGSALIPYLDRGHYLGIDKYIELLIYGVAEELGTAVYKDKRPEFVVSDSFEFAKFSRQPDYCFAQSIFTHLSRDDIEDCLRKLRAFVGHGCRLFATYSLPLDGIENFTQSHSRQRVAYVREEMEAFGRNTGWEPRNIGDWGHPRGQQMMEFRPA